MGKNPNINLLHSKDVCSLEELGGGIPGLRSDNIQFYLAKLNKIWLLASQKKLLLLLKSNIFRLVCLFIRTFIKIGLEGLKTHNTCGIRLFSTKIIFRLLKLHFPFFLYFRKKCYIIGNKYNISSKASLQPPPQMSDH